jgi:hypothetical protein
MLWEDRRRSEGELRDTVGWSPEEEKDGPVVQIRPKLVSSLVRPDGERSGDQSNSEKVERRMRREPAELVATETSNKDGGGGDEEECDGAEGSCEGKNCQAERGEEMKKERQRTVSDDSHIVLRAARRLDDRDGSSSTSSVLAGSDCGGEVEHDGAVSLETKGNGQHRKRAKRHEGRKRGKDGGDG